VAVILIIDAQHICATQAGIDEATQQGSPSPPTSRLCARSAGSTGAIGEAGSNRSCGILWRRRKAEYMATTKGRIYMGGEVRYFRLKEARSAAELPGRQCPISSRHDVCRGVAFLYVCLVFKLLSSHSTTPCINNN
jgi:hypothetical protein